MPDSIPLQGILPDRKGRAIGDRRGAIGKAIARADQSQREERALGDRLGATGKSGRRDDERGFSHTLPLTNSPCFFPIACFF